MANNGETSSVIQDYLLPQEHTANVSNSNVDPKLGHNSIVGKRILCIPSTFILKTPSPVQITSSLWSKETLETLKEDELSKLNWCPIHHHHQEDQEELIKQIQNRKTGLTVSGVRNEASSSQKFHKRGRTDKRGEVQPGRITYQVMKTKLEQQATHRQQQQSEAIHPLELSEETKSFQCESCTLRDTRSAVQNPLVNLPWAPGIIRAVNHQDLKSENLKLMIEFDLHNFTTRRWFYPHSRPVFLETSRSEGDDVHDSERRKRKRIDNLEVGLSTSESNSMPTTSEQTDWLPGDFKVLLIEETIGVARRKMAPIGGEKLWPTRITSQTLCVIHTNEIRTKQQLVASNSIEVGVKTSFEKLVTNEREMIMKIFKPFVDEVGFFDDSINQLVAIEYFDPTTTTTTAKQNCDITAILDDLELDFAQLPSLSTYTNHSTNPESVGNDELTPTIDCQCWSPRVDFQPKCSLISIQDYNQELHTLTTNKTLNNDGGVRFNEEEKPTSIRSVGSFKRFCRFFHLAYQITRPACMLTQASDKISSKETRQNDLLVAMRQYPQLYQTLRDWHLFWDSQAIMTSALTAPLLVSNRVRVYSLGTTQWYTAVIVACDGTLMTLIDDTVLQERITNPCLLEMHLLCDEGLVESIIEGDIDAATNQTLGSARSRRNQRHLNQRQAAQTAQIAIMSALATSTSSGAGSGGGHSNTSSGHMTCKQQNRNSYPCPSPSPSAASSSSSSLFSNQQPLDGVQSNLNSDTDGRSSSSSSARKQAGSRNHLGSKEDGARSRGRRLQTAEQQHNSKVSNDIDFTALCSKEPWITRSVYQDSNFNGATNDKTESISEFESLPNNQTASRFATPFRGAGDISSPKLGKPRGPQLDGRNFLSHMLRLEAMERPEAPSAPATEVVAKALNTENLADSYETVSSSSNNNHLASHNVDETNSFQRASNLKVHADGEPARGE